MNANFGRDIVTKKTVHVSKSDVYYSDMNRKTQAALSDATNFSEMSSGEIHFFACDNHLANNAPEVAIKSPTPVTKKNGDNVCLLNKWAVCA